MLRYPVRLAKDDNGTFLVTFPDFPEAHTFGDTKEEAVARAGDALETIIDAYIRGRRPVPTPASTSATPGVSLPALVAAKVQLYEAMRTSDIGKAELARRLNVHLPQVDRLLDLRHGSKLDQLEAAARALGGRLEVQFVSHAGSQHSTDAGRTAGPRRRKRTASSKRVAVRKAGHGPTHTRT
jgi:antitoxin HicB